MCILAFVTQFSPRFPFILISNRDELFDRLTYPVGIDASTGLLWAVDGVAGGSWLGLDVRKGRFAVLTNCKRSPTAPLQCDVSCSLSEWRGAVPLAELVRRVKVHAKPAVDGGTDVYLEFVPDHSRGCIVRDFLMEGKVPGDCHLSSGASKSAAVSPSLLAPYFDGYNLLTAESLYNADGLELLYTTNRYGAEHRAHTDHGVIHCLQNSYLDNWMEPKLALLKEEFEKAIATVIPTDTGFFDREYVTDFLASSCLCLEPKFDLLYEIQKGTLPAAKLSDYRQVLDASLPYNGYDGEAELTELYGAGLQPPLHFPVTGHVERENISQQDIFLTAPTHGTRTQTVVVVERLPGKNEAVVHFSQRECVTSGVHEDWNHFTISSHSV